VQEQTRLGQYSITREGRTTHRPAPTTEKHPPPPGRGQGELCCSAAQSSLHDVHHRRLGRRDASTGRETPCSASNPTQEPTKTRLHGRAVPGDSTLPCTIDVPSHAYGYGVGKRKGQHAKQSPRKIACPLPAETSGEPPPLYRSRARTYEL
jgi:hypothetical protein